MTYLVKAREQKWRGERLFQGAVMAVETDRERAQADLLVKVGRAEMTSDRPAPMRHAATVAPLEAIQETETAAHAEPETIETAALKAEDPEPDQPSHGQGYKTRRLKARD